MKSVLQDVRYGARMLRSSWGFTLVAIITLALGIGATTAIFSIVDTVLIRPLPYPQANRLVWAWGTFTGGNQAAISIPDFIDYRRQDKSFEEFAAFVSQASFNLAGDQAPEQVYGAVVSCNLFRALSIQPALGRDFLPDDEKEQ